MRKPTPKQGARLLTLGSGNIVLTPRRADWAPLLRHGWVRHAEGFGRTPTGGYLPPLRITPDGLRALAQATERDGLPGLTPRDETTIRECADCGGRRYRFVAVTAEEVLAGANA